MARNPVETLEFFGIRPGDVVLEALPGDGWYSKILMPYLGEKGRLIGVDYSLSMWPEFGGFATPEFIKKREQWPAQWRTDAKRWGSAQVDAYTFADLPADLTGQVDAVLFIRALHNLARFDAKGQYLQQALAQPLLVNQLQMSLADINWLEESVLVGMPEGGQRHFGYGTVEYCQQQGVQVQSWGSLAKGVFSGAPPQNAQHAATAQLVAQLSEHYSCSAEAIVLAWLMRHPSTIQPVIGTIQPARIAACTEACGITLSREHWYALYVAARGKALP